MKTSEYTLSKEGEVLFVKIMVEEKDIRIIEACFSSEVRVSFLSKARDQMNRHSKVVQWHNGTHRSAVTPVRSAQDVHTMDGIGGEPHPSWQVCLRNDVEPLNIREVEGALCWDVPDGMKYGTNLSHKKASHVS